MLHLKKTGWILVILVGFAAGTLGARWIFDLTGTTGKAAAQLEPNDPSTLSPLAFSTDAIIANLQQYLLLRPADGVAYGNLGIAYLQKARETGDPVFYVKAEGTLNKALDLNRNDFRSLAGLGALALARHQFREALDWGEQARALNPYNAGIYGVMGDAQIELGDYPAAFDTFQKMVDLRPGLPAYSRVSYARELSGDLPGAIQAMQQAIEAEAPNSQAANWARVQLGNLYFNQGDYAPAEQAYQSAVSFLPDYAYALAGLGNVRAAQGRYDEAISLYSRVVKTMPLPQFVIALGDIYAAAGRNDDAARQYGLVEMEEKLFEANGVDIEAELALFDADHDRDLAQALVRARAGYTRRPSITVADVLAWTLYKNRDYAEAQAMMTQAQRLGTRNALMYYHAGMIAYRLGNDSDAVDYLDRARSLNPRFSLLYADSARELLSQLRHQPH